jgi:SAM-dependent methyltransferase
MFTESAAFYDLIYALKDYEGEAVRVHELIQRHKRSPGNRLLDAACGTGLHLQYLKAHYTVEGFDLDAELLALAHRRLPDVLFHHADMTQFDLGKEYDAITCLFSAIGYVETDERLRQAAAAFRKHLVMGGVLIVEPWFVPGEFHPDTVHARFVDEPELKLIRMNVSKVEGRISLLNFQYMVGTPQGITTFSEVHRLGMFTPDEYRAAFESAGFKVTHDPKGLDGRGLFIGEVVD